MSLPQRFKDFRTKRGFSQLELAGLLEVSQQTIQHYEAGKTEPCATVLTKFHEIGGDVLYLLTGKAGFPAYQDIIHGMYRQIVTYREIIDTSALRYAGPEFVSSKRKRKG